MWTRVAIKMFQVPRRTKAVQKYAFSVVHYGAIARGLYVYCFYLFCFRTGDIIVLLPYLVRTVTTAGHEAVSPVKVPWLLMNPTVAAAPAQVTAGHYVLRRESWPFRPVRVDANAVAHSGRHGNGVARLTVALVVHLPDGRTLVPFTSSVERGRQIQRIPKAVADALLQSI